MCHGKYTSQNCDRDDQNSFKARARQRVLKGGNKSADCGRLRLKLPFYALVSKSLKSDGRSFKYIEFSIQLLSYLYSYRSLSSFH